MVRAFPLLVLFPLCALPLGRQLPAAESTTAATADSHAVSTLLAEFEEYSGGRLVFERNQLPEGSYHDIMLPLSPRRRAQAAEIALREIRKYPPRFLEKIGLRAIGLFEACASKAGDGFRPFDRDLGGYRYYGIWNGRNGVAAAYYSDTQLPLTLHHEVFHHVDGTRAGKTSYTQYFAADDIRFSAAVAGDRPYAPLPLSEADRAALRRRARGSLLRDAVSEYAAKHPGEDQAETARYLLTTLPDALLQAAEQPELPGSQRILHVLAQYAAALEGEADTRWFVDTALQRQRQPAPRAPGGGSDLVAALQRYCRAAPPRDELTAAQEAVRAALETLARLEPAKRAELGDISLLPLAAETTRLLMRNRIQPRGEAEGYVIWGTEDADGVNWTLRADIAAFGADAERLARIPAAEEAEQEARLRAQLQNLRRMADYYRWIDAQWRVTGGTRAAFEGAKQKFLNALPAEQGELAAELKRLDFSEIARRLPADGSPLLLPAAPAPPTNRFLPKVDAEIADPQLRAALRRVQPACVRVGGASGVCLTPDGLILTAAHVPDRLGAKQTCLFPDGREFLGVCVAINTHLDLALVKVEGKNLPTAAPARTAPAAGSWVCCIGQPGRYTPSGEATNYQPWHVSTGRIRGFLANPLGSQALGRTKHDAWTYWGHSGSPLFNSEGEIVALHNSWDSNTAMRHAVPHEAILHFLKEAKVAPRVAE